MCNLTLCVMPYTQKRSVADPYLKKYPKDTENLCFYIAQFLQIIHLLLKKIIYYCLTETWIGATKCINGCIMDSTHDSDNGVSWLFPPNNL